MKKKSNLKNWVAVSIAAVILSFINSFITLVLILKCDASNIPVNYWFISIVWALSIFGLAIVAGTLSDLNSKSYDIDRIDQAVIDYEDMKIQMETARDKYTELLTK